jgi:hypothetical protein
MEERVVTLLETPVHAISEKSEMHERDPTMLNLGGVQAWRRLASALIV